MLTGFEHKIWQVLKALSPRLHEALFKRRLVIVFLVAGGAALVADVGTLYICKGIFGIALIPAVAIAFLAGFCVSFLLQKFWTFGDMSVDRVHAQAGFYFVVAVANFFLTIFLMYVLVEVLHFWYIISKIFVSGGIASVTFFVYKIFIFKLPR
ncbi:MAG: GtrA family protein [bacterium]|nr:GtrA family protein [bacterium]